jgi:hypothetical protein
MVLRAQQALPCSMKPPLLLLLLLLLLLPDGCWYSFCRLHSSIEGRLKNTGGLRQCNGMRGMCTALC